MQDAAPAKTEEHDSETSTIAALSGPVTPTSSQTPSESEYTQQSSPTTSAQTEVPSPKPTPTQSSSQHARKDTRTAIAVPNIPNLPRSRGTPPLAEKQQARPPPTLGDAPVQNQDKPTEAEVPAVEEPPKTLPKPAAPKSWADLVRTKNAVAASVRQNGAPAHGVASLPKSASLAEALKQYTVRPEHVSFLEPRGLVNTGNMCYMNSVGHLRTVACKQDADLDHRFCKFLSFARHSTTFWRRSSNGPFTR
jgi:ubiquitin carboxyl-terminal hydrolase 10